MKREDIQFGMKVKLLGKHAFGDNYDNIEDFYDECNEIENVIKMKEQGYGIVVDIDEDYKIVVNNDFDENEGWYFLSSDLEPYYKEDLKESEDLIQEKTLKDWIVTPKVVFTVETGKEYFVGNKGYAYSLDSGDLWCHYKNESYDEELNHISGIAKNRINKIEYQGKVLWERKEEYFTLTEAIQLNKQIKHKDWEYFYEVSSALKGLSDIVDESTNNDFIIEALSEKVWEVR